MVHEITVKTQLDAMDESLTDDDIPRPRGSASRPDADLNNGLKMPVIGLGTLEVFISAFNQSYGIGDLVEYKYFFMSFFFQFQLQAGEQPAIVRTM